MELNVNFFVLQVDRFIRGESMGAMMDRFLNSQPSSSSYGGSSTAAIQVRQPWTTFYVPHLRTEQLEQINLCLLFWIICK